MDNLRRLLGIRRMGRVPNALIKELCRVRKGVDEWIYEGVLRWFGPVEGIGKKVYIRVCW